MVKRGDSWKMDISVLTVGPIQTNCYVVHQEGNSQCVVIDPGEEAAKIADFLKRKGLECKGILLTHGHFDHIMAVQAVLNLAGFDIKAIHTPGHTKGGCCYYSEEDKVVFCGDTLFMESIGRTDFPTGNGRELIDSLKNRLLVLPGDVTAYPGHGPETTIDYEQANNPYA